MVIVGVNVDHKELLESVQDNFSKVPVTSPNMSKREKTIYRGGELRIEGGMLHTLFINFFYILYLVCMCMYVN